MLHGLVVIVGTETLCEKEAAIKDHRVQTMRSKAFSCLHCHFQPVPAPPLDESVRLRHHLLFNGKRVYEKSLWCATSEFEH